MLVCMKLTCLRPVENARSASTDVAEHEKIVLIACRSSNVFGNSPGAEQ